VRAGARFNYSLQLLKIRLVFIPQLNFYNYFDRRGHFLLQDRALTCFRVLSRKATAPYSTVRVQSFCLQ